MADTTVRKPMAAFLKGIKERPRPSSLRDILKELAESSSLHGIPKIMSSRQIAVKVLWCLLFLATSSVLGYQLVNLFRTYYSYPIQTSVSLQFSSIRFPAISICNMNPVRKSMLDQSEALTELFSQTPNVRLSLRRKRREASDTSTLDGEVTPLEYNNINKQVITRKIKLNQQTYYTYFNTENKFIDIENSRREIQDTNPEFDNIRKANQILEVADVEPGAVNSKFIRPTRVIKANGEPFRQGKNIPKSVHRRERAAVDSSFSTIIEPSVSSSSDGDSSMPLISSEYYNTNRSSNYYKSDEYASMPLSSSEYHSSRSVSIDNSNFYSSSPYGDDWSNWWNWYDEGYYEYQYYENDFNYWDYWDNVYENPQPAKNNWDQWIEDMKTALRKTPLPIRQKIGHQQEDLFVTASFAGQEQNVSRLRKFSSNDYGNCYLLSSPKYMALRSGPSLGFKLTMNLEIDDYISDLTTGYGLRLVFHEPDTHPLPSQDGISLSPGTETNIGLKKIEISRLSEPHGHCETGSKFAKQYKIKYSMSACYEFCQIQATVERCSCLPPDAPDGMSFNTTYVPLCNSSVESNNFKCVYNLSKQFSDGSYVCDCREPCQENIYIETMSSTYWPTDEYLRLLLEYEVCSKKNDTMLWKDICLNLLDNDFENDNLERYRNNFLRVLIYFKDLNYERITQEPLYEGVRFLSDIGGAMGLFLGASVLSMVEVAQLILEIILYVRDRCTAKKHKTRVATIKVNK